MAPVECPTAGVIFPIFVIILQTVYHKLTEASCHQLLPHFYNERRIAGHFSECSYMGSFPRYIGIMLGIMASSLGCSCALLSASDGPHLAPVVICYLCDDSLHAS